MPKLTIFGLLVIFIAGCTFYKSTSVEVGGKKITTLYGNGDADMRINRVIYFSTRKID